MAKIHITITYEGEIKILIEGIKGKKCLDLSKELEDGLGRVVEKKLTSEYYEEGKITRTEFLKEKNRW